MLKAIEGAGEFYPFTAALLPDSPGSSILDLGCGTGLKLEWFFKKNPSAAVTGVDLSAGMLTRLKEKFPDKKLQLVCGSYFDVEFDRAQFDAVVSVESLHHFTVMQKTALYKKLCVALKPQGYFILTDYFACSDAEEQSFFDALSKTKRKESASDNVFYHFDTPLTVQHEVVALQKGGFKTVNILKNWGATFVLKAEKD